MTEDEIRGPVGRTDQVLEFGWRKATYTFSLRTYEDDSFTALVHHAMQEMIANHCLESGDEFVSSEGVVVHISWPKLDHSNMDNVTWEQVSEVRNKIHVLPPGFVSIPMHKPVKYYFIDGDWRPLLDSEQSSK